MRRASAWPTARACGWATTAAATVVHAKLFDGVREGVVIVEGIWPNAAFEEGVGINVLTGADPIAPVGGAAFHDNRIWMRPA